MDKKHIEGIFGGLWLIGLGVLFLLNTTGVVPWSVWGQIFRFWPVFIIMAGLNIIVGKSVLGNVVVGLISLTLMVLIVGFAANQAVSPNNSWSLPFITVTSATKEQAVKSSDFTDVKTLAVRMDMSAGEFTLNQDLDSTDLLKLSAKYAEGRTAPELVSEQGDNDLTIRFKQTTTNWGMGWMMWPSFDSRYDLTLGNTELPTSLDFDLSAGSLVARLKQLNLSDMNVTVSAGSADITLSADTVPTKTSDIKVSAGSLTLRVPRSVGLVVDYNVSAGSVEIDGKDVSRGQGSTELNTDADRVVRIDLDVSAGSVEIERF